MLYIPKDEHIRQILSISERTVAIIKHADFSSRDYNAAETIISMLLNNIKSMSVVIALERNECSEKDCYTNTYENAVTSKILSISQKKNLRELESIRKSVSDGSYSPDTDKLLHFLSLYDSFAENFFSQSATVSEMRNKGINIPSPVSIKQETEIILGIRKPEKKHK